MHRRWNLQQQSKSSTVKKLWRSESWQPRKRNLRYLVVLASIDKTKQKICFSPFLVHIGTRRSPYQEERPNECRTLRKHWPWSCAPFYFLGRRRCPAPATDTVSRQKSGTLDALPATTKESFLFIHCAVTPKKLSRFPVSSCFSPK